MGAWRKEFNTPEKRFWAKVDTSGGPDACWPWTGCCVPDGYGRFSCDGQWYNTHVFAFELANGYSVPQVRHSCDNPPCCNDKHLLGGTIKDNMRDKALRGRACKGEKQKYAKLTEAKVAKIRELFVPRHPKFGSAPLARKFGVSYGVLRSVIRGDAWRHVSG